MENTEFIELYNEFKREQNSDFHFQLLSEMIAVKHIQENKIVLEAKNEFSRDNFKARYLKSLQEKLTQKTQNAILEIILNKPSKDNDTQDINAKNQIYKKIEMSKIKKKNRSNSHIQEFPFAGSVRNTDNIDPKLNFSNYVEGDHNSWAIAVGRALCRERNENYNPFFVWASVGMGKTHLLHSIGNACKKYHQKVLYTNTESFFNNFINAIKTNKQEYFKKKYRDVDVLLIDDIHDLQNKSKAQDELFYIFNHFQEQGKQLIFTCDRPPNELKEFTERLLSRLKSGTNVSIGVPSYEVRLAIIESKARELDLQIQRNVTEFLAENISDSIRDISGAMKKIQTFSGLLGQGIDLDMANRELQEFFSQRQKPIMVQSIQKHIALYYNLELSDVLGKRRNANIALARQVAMFLCRELTPLSTTELGRLFDRDHATIITGVKKIKKMQQADHKFAAELEKLKYELQTK